MANLLSPIENELRKLTQMAAAARSKVQIVAPTEVPRKIGLQSAEGQARLLHDLANIELQAIELGLRTLNDFTDAPYEFRAALTAVTLEEGLHFQLCLDGILELGFDWGQWPVHTRLNDSISANDSLLERIFIVHCYLEGSGLDAGEILLRKLSGVRNIQVQKIVKQIVNDELKHVAFGVRWFREIALIDGLDPKCAMNDTLVKLASKNRLPARGAAIANEARLLAGFTVNEIENIQQHQNAGRGR